MNHPPEFNAACYRHTVNAISSMLSSPGLHKLLLIPEFILVYVYLKSGGTGIQNGMYKFLEEDELSAKPEGCVDNCIYVKAEF